MRVKRGGIVVVDLEGHGSVQTGRRPCVVVQNNAGNTCSTTLIVVPLTTSTGKKRLPTHVDLVCDNGVKNTALCEQIHTIDKQQLKTPPLESVSDKDMVRINKALKISLAL